MLGSSSSSSHGASGATHDEDAIALLSTTPVVDGDDQGLLEECPHSGRLYIDRLTSNTWQLTDIVTHEKYLFSGDGWFLEYHADNGRAALVQEDGHGNGQFFLVEQLMVRDLLESPDGVQFMSFGAAANTPPVPLGQLYCRHVLGSVTIRLGQTTARAELPVWILKRPRCSGMRVYWGLFSIYKLLRLTQFRGQASKWTYAGMLPWNKHMALHFPGKHFIVSKNNSGMQTDLRHLQPFWDRMLPETTCDTVALLSLLAKWAFASKHGGGFQCPLQQRGAIDVLAALLSKACSRAQPIVIQISFDDFWTCKWPRPERTDSDLAFWYGFPMNNDGSVYIEPWLQCGGGFATSSVARRWLQCLSEDHSTPLINTIDLMDLIRRIAGIKLMQSFSAQLVYALAKELELGMAESGKSSESQALSASVGFVYKSQEIHVGDPNLEERLCSYVSAGIVESSKHSLIGVSLDKAGVCGSHLMNAIVSFPNNVVVVACPQDCAMCRPKLSRDLICLIFDWIYI
jgi:hypothetical protein